MINTAPSKVINNLFWGWIDSALLIINPKLMDLMAAKLKN
jgi:hypothetical protein